MRCFAASLLLLSSCATTSPEYTVRFVGRVVAVPTDLAEDGLVPDLKVARAGLWTEPELPDGFIGYTFVRPTNAVRGMNAVGETGGSENMPLPQPEFDVLGLPQPAPWETQAFLWTNDGHFALHPAGVPGLTKSVVADLNEAGMAVGTAQIQGKFQVFVWNDEQLDLLEPPFGNAMTAHAVNSSGTLVGRVFENLWDSFDSRGYVRADGQFLFIGDEDGTSSASDINDAGEVVGLGEFDGERRAYIWRDGELEFIEDVIDVLANNEAGDVLVRRRTFLDDGSVRYDIGIWADGSFIEIASGAQGSDDLKLAPADLNDDRTVVGRRIVSGAEFSAEAFRWRDGELESLNDLIADDSGWYLLSAVAINEAGQIAGNGIFENRLHGFVLEPIE